MISGQASAPGITGVLFRLGDGGLKLRFQNAMLGHKYAS
jgi:hypothetical protein